jgi:hypothetical protein
MRRSTGANARSRLAIGLLLVAVTAIPGCGSDELNSPTAAKLRALGNLYLDYAGGKNNKGPGNEQEFKKHIRGLPDQVLSPIGVDRNAVDLLFSSERDQQPFVVIYGLAITQISGTSAPLVAHEKTGKNGKRLVAFANAKVELIDESRLQELLAAKQ